MMTLSRDPQDVTPQLWYYEEKRGLLIVHEIRDAKTDAFIRTDQTLIPWRMIKASVKRAPKR